MARRAHMRPAALLVLLALLLPAGGPAVAAVPAAPLARRVEAYLAPLTTGGGFSGRVLVGDAHSVLYEGGFGPAGELGPAARYRLGSLTKQFTAACLMRLAEAGKLSPDDSLAKYLPGFPHAAEISLHQLLTHTAGVSEFSDDPGYLAGAGRPRDLAALMATFAGKPLDFKPGSAFAYSNSNYILLQAVLEKVGGAPLAELMAREVFGPAGMTGALLQTGADPPDLAPGMVLDPDMAPRPFADWHPSAIAGAGAVVARARDLWQYHHALCSGTLLSAASQARMATPDAGAYGYGWGIIELFGEKALVHLGKWEGFSAYLIRLPGQGLCVAVLSNYFDAPTARVGQDLLALALGREVATPSRPEPGRATGAYVSSCTGEYLSDSGRTVNVFAVDPAELNRQADPVPSQRYLYADFDGSGPVQFFPRKGGGFFTLEAELTLSFSGPEGKPPDAVLVHGAKSEFSAKRKQ